jgi:NitT/TauT family transport system permease protein
MNNVNHKFNYISILYPIPALIFFLAWHIFTLDNPKRQFIFSTPQKVLEALFKLVTSGDLLRHAGTTMEEAIAGFFLGTTVGALLGLALWSSQTLAKVSRPYITALGTVPVFALAPMIISWFGIGMVSKIALAFISTVIVALVQAYQGAMSAEPRYLKLLQVLGATRLQAFKIVIVPSSLIWVVNAMKLNIGLALLGAFIGEFISAEQGLGYLMVKAAGVYDMATVLAGTTVLILIAIILTSGIEKLERHLLRWQSI